MRTACLSSCATVAARLSSEYGFAMQAQSGMTRSKHPYATIGAGDSTLFVFGGIEPKHVVPDGLHLQGIARAFKSFAETHRTIVLKRPARSDREYSQARMAEDYAEAIDELAPSGQVAIMGIAAGGTIAQMFAGMFPGRVSQLVLVSTAYRVSEPGRQALDRGVALAENGEFRALNREMIRRLYPSRVASAFYGALAWLLPGLSAEDDPAEFICEAESGAAADASGYLGAISAQSLLLCGDRDFFYDAGDVARTAQLIPDCELVLFKNQGHGLPRTHADEINARVRRFLASRG